MAPTSVASVSRNGHHPAPVLPIRTALATAAASVDHLAELRDLIRRAQAEERKLTAELVATMQARRVQALHGAAAIAVLESRTTLSVDPALFLEAAGARAPEALSVKIEAARTLLSEETLRAIAEARTSPVLRVEPWAPGAAA